jgi:hypothetical protein
MALATGRLQHCTILPPIANSDLSPPLIIGIHRLSSCVQLDIHLGLDVLRETCCSGWWWCSIAWRNIPSRCCSSIRPASAHPATLNLSYMRLTRGPCLSCHAMSRTSERAADVSTAASLRLKDAKTLNARQPHSRFLDTDHHSLAYFRSCEYLHRQRHHHHLHQYHHTLFRPPPTVACETVT